MTESDVRVVCQGYIDTYETKVGEPRHKENTRKIDRLTWITAVGLGIVLTLNSLMAAGVLHVK